ncbi:hypothetical protein MKZ38_001639 [Zalerion maritima]|uniref:Uncharacterized protein n=1 Tax=Zalerion maritima TaxID=339359 RepID=A0AAD5RQ09_9PEZI|nr:hypothetical protein MKZ38_001639 [Zalerion maritima]
MSLDHRTGGCGRNSLEDAQEFLGEKGQSEENQIAFDGGIRLKTIVADALRRCNSSVFEWTEQWISEYVSQDEISNELDKCARKLVEQRREREALGWITGTDGRTAEGAGLEGSADTLEQLQKDCREMEPKPDEEEEYEHEEEDVDEWELPSDESFAWTSLSTYTQDLEDSHPLLQLMGPVLDRPMSSSRTWRGTVPKEPSNPGRKGILSRLPDEEQRFIVFAILFPNTPKPSSAYIDGDLAYESQPFRDYALDQGPAFLDELMEEHRSQAELSTITDAEYLMGRRRILREGLEMLLDNFDTGGSSNTPSTTLLISQLDVGGNNTSSTTLATTSDQLIAPCPKRCRRHPHDARISGSSPRLSQTTYRTLRYIHIDSSTLCESS